MSAPERGAADLAIRVAPPTRPSGRRHADAV